MTNLAPPTSARADDTPGGSIEALVAAKAGRTIGVCIPARNEAATIGPIVSAIIDWLVPAGLIDAVVVVDDGSTDATGGQAASAGAHVVRRATAPGKGEALRCAISRTAADVLVFLDADVTNFSPWFVVALAAPLLGDPHTMLVKAAYERPLHGRPGEGGRVTELVARPLLERFFPDLAEITQPLAGEFAIRQEALADIALADGYAVDIALLIDVYQRYGRQAITEVDLGERRHRNRPLHELRPHSRAVFDAVLTRAVPAGTHSYAPGLDRNRHVHNEIEGQRR
jgi:glucosyl-3-phosphoglycerate synthase